MTPRRSLARTTLLLLPLQIVFRGVEAVLPLLLALWFGRNDLTDVYYFAWAVFALAGSLVFTAFQDSAVVPVLAEVSVRQPELVPVVRGSLLAHTVAFGSLLSVLFGALAAGWFSVRYSGESRTLALCMVVPFALYLVCSSLKTYFASMLNAEHHYAPLPVASALGAGASIGFIAAARHALSIASVPCGSLLGELIATGVLLLASHRAGIRMTPTFARPEPVRRIASLVASEIGGSAITRANPVIDQLMAGWAGVAGGGTLLKLSSDVATLPTSLLQAALLPVLLTHLSDDLAAGSVARARRTIARALIAVVTLLTAMTGLLWAVRAPLLHLVFAHGAMDVAGVERMERLFTYNLLGLAPFGALLVLARAHVAAQNGRIMVSMGVLNAALNAGLNVVLLPVLGLEGIALSTSCTYAVVAGVFALRLRSGLEGREARA
ncbi:MAG: hypothetical protein M3O50_02870 [Myxococcota bacterium]|nr:hypothetical protein [Myxococcota bacterium]